jgi:hypothetical protein
MPDHFHALIRIPQSGVCFGGWHSPKEKEILEWLLKKGRQVIACPAWGIEDCAFTPGVREALEENRLLILETGAVIARMTVFGVRNV